MVKDHVIAFLDCTKLGRLNKDTLAEGTAMIAKILDWAKEKRACGVLVAPHLASSKALKGLRGELRSLGSVTLL